MVDRVKHFFRLRLKLTSFVPTKRICLFSCFLAPYLKKARWSLMLDVQEGRPNSFGRAWVVHSSQDGQGRASPSQLASSERSWQSASPSQRRRRSTHWPRAQGNWEAEHTGQPSSSLWSAHSGKPSQRQAPGMQSISPVAQAN